MHIHKRWSTIKYKPKRIFMTFVILQDVLVTTFNMISIMMIVLYCVHKSL